MLETKIHTTTSIIYDQEIGESPLDRHIPHPNLHFLPQLDHTFVTAPPKSVEGLIVDIIIFLQPIDTHKSINQELADLYKHTIRDYAGDHAIESLPDLGREEA